MDLLTKNELRQLIADGETEQTLEALQGIAEYTGDNELLTAVLLQHAQYSQYKKERTYNLTSDEDLDRTLNRINFALFGIINDLSEPYQKAATPLAVQKSKQGSILYHFPNPMQLGEESKCSIRIAFEEIILRADWTDMEDTMIQSVRISDVMTVELLEPGATPNFEIRSFSSKEQFIDKDDFTEWLFYVKPLRQGSFPLLLRVGVIEVINDRERRREIVLEETIDIVAELAKEAGPTTAFKTADYALSLTPATSSEIAIPPPEPAATGGFAPDAQQPPSPTKRAEVDRTIVQPAPTEIVVSASRKRRNVLPWIAGITTVLLLAVLAIPALFQSGSPTDNVEVTEGLDNPFDPITKGDGTGSSDTTIITFTFSVFLYEINEQGDTLPMLDPDGKLILDFPELGQQSSPAAIDSNGQLSWQDLPGELLGETVAIVLQSDRYSLAGETPVFVLQDAVAGVQVVRQ